LIPGRGSDGMFSSFPPCSDCLWGPLSLLSSGYGGRGLFCPGIKQPGHEADHLLPSTVKVKNAWSYTSTPPVCLYDAVLN